MVERRRPQDKREGPIGRGQRSEQERPDWQKRVHRDQDVEKSPLIPSQITPEDLDMGVRVQLKTLTAENAEMVARHLAMVSLLINDDPNLAHKHALAASRRASRLAVVHETLGLTAYAIGDFALALRELLTHRRLSGSNDQLPIIVDSERGMGRPERALEAVVGVDRSKLPVGVRINLAIALSGARLDLGQAKLAKQELEIKELSPKQVFEQSPLLFRSYAEVLRELGADGDEWEALANRAEKAFADAGEEVLNLIEEIPIPTSEDFERKPKREFAPRERDGRPRAPRPGSSDRTRDGERSYPRRDASDRPPRSSGDRPYQKRDDYGRPARKPRPDGERTYPRKDSGERVTRGPRPEGERSYPRRENSERSGASERSYPRRDSSARPARGSNSSGERTYKRREDSADSPVERKYPKREGQDRKPASERYYGKGDGTNRAASGERRTPRKDSSTRSSEGRFSRKEDEAKPNETERRFVKRSGPRPNNAGKPNSSSRGGRGKAR